MKKKRADGRYEITRTIDEKRLHGYGPTKSAAKEDLERKVEAFKKGIVTGGRQTVNQYFEKWQESRKGTVKPNSLYKQQCQYNRIKAVTVYGRAFGTYRLEQVKPETVRELQRVLATEKMLSGNHKNPKALTPQAVNDYLSFLSHVFNDAAVVDRIVEYNPFQGVKPLIVNTKPATETKHRALTAEEAKAFEKAAESSWYGPLTSFMAASGLRLSEAAALKPKDITNGVIKVQATWTRSETGYSEIGDPKTRAGKRTIPITADMQNAINRQKALTEALNNGALPLDKPLFVSPTGLQVRASGFNLELAKICEAADIPKITSHALRSCFATRALESGMNPKTLQAILGHSDFGTTMNTYAHVLPDTKAEEMQMVRAGIM